jgi:amidase/aspartyl-tRNA(Asn)/glutamyl-tRNA(Gln) amidotransferase subunit A
MTAFVSETRPDHLTGASALCRLSAAELAQGYQSRSLSPVEVAREVVARAETINPRYSAFTMIDHEDALEDAARSEARWMKREPLSMADSNVIH